MIFYIFGFFFHCWKLKQTFHNRNPGVQLSWKKYGRTLELIRDNTIPQNPTSCNEIRNAFQDEKIMSTLGRSKHIGHGIFFDGVVERETHSFCVFSSKKAISLIEKNIKVEDRHYMCDATFAVCPIGPFSQLLLIHVTYIENVSLFFTVFFLLRNFWLYFNVNVSHFKGLSLPFHFNEPKKRRSL